MTPKLEVDYCLRVCMSDRGDLTRFLMDWLITQGRLQPSSAEYFIVAHQMVNGELAIAEYLIRSAAPRRLLQNHLVIGSEMLLDTLLAAHPWATMSLVNEPRGRYMGRPELLVKLTPVDAETWFVDHGLTTQECRRVVLEATSLLASSPVDHQLLKTVLPAYLRAVLGVAEGFSWPLWAFSDTTSSIARSRLVESALKLHELETVSHELPDDSLLEGKLVSALMNILDRLQVLAVPDGGSVVRALLRTFGFRCIEVDYLFILSLDAALLNEWDAHERA